MKRIVSPSTLLLVAFFILFFGLESMYAAEGSLDLDDEIVVVEEVTSQPSHPPEHGQAPSMTSHADCALTIDELSGRLASYAWYESPTFGSLGRFTLLNTRAWAQSFSRRTGIVTRFLSPGQEQQDFENIKDLASDLIDQSICDAEQIHRLETEVYSLADSLSTEFREFDRDFVKNNLLIGSGLTIVVLTGMTGGLLFKNRQLRKQLMAIKGSDGKAKVHFGGKGIGEGIAKNVKRTVKKVKGDS